MTRSRYRYLFHDVVIVALSVFIAFLFVKTNIIGHTLTANKERELIGSFVAGIFSTSVFTTAPALVTLGEIAQAYSPVVVAFIGALGAVVGDLLIFRFVKDRLSEHIVELVHLRGGRRRAYSFFRRKFFRGFTFLLGGLIIASPLPDELGVSLLGFSRMKLSGFILLSFCFNFLGILAVGLFARSFV